VCSVSEAAGTSDKQLATQQLQKPPLAKKHLSAASLATPPFQQTIKRRNVNNLKVKVLDVRQGEDGRTSVGVHAGLLC
jgi:hypothetical protein